MFCDNLEVPSSRLPVARVLLVLGVVLGLGCLGLVPVRSLGLELAWLAGLARLDSLVGSEDVHTSLPLPGHHLVVSISILHREVEGCLLGQVLRHLLHDLGKPGTSEGLRLLGHEHSELSINLCEPLLLLLLPLDSRGEREVVVVSHCL